MIVAPPPVNEKLRLQELYDYHILDTAEEEDYNDLVELASVICNTPISLITFLDANRQWIKSKKGIAIEETSRDISFCSHAILEDNVFEVPDALLDERFRDNPFVTGDPRVRFYAGIPLVTRTGARLGTLCVIDRVEKHLTGEQRHALEALGNQVMKLLELHRSNGELKHYIFLEQEQRMALQRSSKMQQLMIAIIAHDVRGPLATSKSVLEMFNEELLDEAETKELMGHAAVQLDGTLHLLNNLVEWGMLQLKTTQRNFTTLLLWDTIEQVRRLLMGKLSAKQNTFINNTDPALLVTTDQNILQFLLRNISDNSNKFTSKGTITVSAHAGKDYIAISLCDTGTGMSDEVKRNLFSWVKPQTTLGTDNEKGSGLGLLLTKQFMDQLNGTIDIESTSGKGTCITLTLPDPIKDASIYVS